MHLWKWAPSTICPYVAYKCVVAQQATLGLESIPTYTNQACTSHGPHTQKKVGLINECVNYKLPLAKDPLPLLLYLCYGTFFLSFTQYITCCCLYVEKRHTMRVGPHIASSTKALPLLLLLFSLVCPRPNPSFAQKRYMMPRHTLAPSTIRYTLAPCQACFGHIIDN